MIETNIKVSDLERVYAKWKKLVDEGKKDSRDAIYLSGQMSILIPALDSYIPEELYLKIIEN